MRFLDDIRLSEAGPVDFRRIPPWRHQTGSSFPEWFPVLPTCFPDRCRPPEAGPIVRNIKHRSGILLPVCCRHAGSPRNSSSRRSTSANITWDTSSKPGTTSKPMVHSMILRVETWWKRTGPTSPDRRWAISSLFVDRFRRGRLFLDRPVAQRRFQRWRTQTGSSFLLHNFMSGVGSLDGNRLPQMCRTWIYRKNAVSDNRGSYENWPYLRCLSTDFEKVDCSKTSPAGGPPSISKMADPNRK